MRGTAASKPNLPMCHLCGRQFGSSSLKIHMKACTEKYERERGRPPPEAPSAHLGGEDRPVGKGMTAREVEEYNDAAYSAWSGDLEPCPHCSRRFLPDRLEVHLRSCNARPAEEKKGGSGGKTKASKGDGLTEWERAQGKRSSGGKKSLPVCHLCGREFGTASLKIHLKTCAERYEREKGKPAPPPPELLAGLLGDDDRPLKPTQKDWDAYNEAAYEASKAEMEPCPNCGRTFSSKDRLAVHMRSCATPTADVEKRKLAEATVDKWQREAASARGAPAARLGPQKAKAKTARDRAIVPGSGAVARRRWELAGAMETGLDPSALAVKAAAERGAQEAQRLAILAQVEKQLADERDELGDDLGDDLGHDLGDDLGDDLGVEAEACEDGAFAVCELAVDEAEDGAADAVDGMAAPGAAMADGRAATLERQGSSWNPLTWFGAAEPSGEPSGEPIAEASAAALPPRPPPIAAPSIATDAGFVRPSTAATTPPAVPPSPRAARASSPRLARASSPRPSRASSPKASAKKKPSPRAGSKKATAPSAAPVSAGAGGKKTVRERMLQLNELLADELITQDEFAAKRAAILEAL